MANQAGDRDVFGNLEKGAEIFGEGVEDAWNWAINGARGQTDYRAGNEGISEYDPRATAAAQAGQAEWDAQMRQAWLDALASGKSWTPEVAGMIGKRPGDAPAYDPEGARLYEDRANMLNLADTHGAELLKMNRDAALGLAPSQAQDLLREGTSRTAASAYGMAASAPGGGAARAAAMNQAGWQAAGANQAGARQGAQLRAQEMSDAATRYGQSVQNVGQLYNQQQGTDLTRATANQDARVQANSTNAGIAKSNAENDKGFAMNAISALTGSDIRVKEDIAPVAAPVFKSTMQQQGDDPYQLMLDRDAEERRMADIVRANTQQQPSAAPKKSGGGGGGGGILGAIGSFFSDENSKERIRELESALASTTSELRDTKVEYPTLGLGANRVAPTDLVYDQRSDQMRTPDEQLRYSRALGGGADPLKRPAAERLFLSDDESQMRTPMEQYEHQASLKRDSLDSPDGSRQALAPVGEYEYRYKPEFAKASGEDTEPRLGIMAQDLERSPSPELRSAVIDTPKGKAIDGSRALSANLALSAGLDKRIRGIEDALGGESATLGLSRRMGR